MRCILAVVAILALPLSAAAADVKVDRRTQVISTVYWLATEGKAFDGYVDEAYAKRTKFYFHRYDKHPAFQYAKKLNAAGFTATEAMEWILTHSPLPELKASDASKDAAKEPVTADDLSAFASALRDFVDDTNFDGFLDQQSMRLLGQASRAKTALAEHPVDETDVQILVTPLVGTQTWRVKTSAGEYIVINPVGHRSIPELQAALGDSRATRD